MHTNDANKVISIIEWCSQAKNSSWEYIIEWVWLHEPYYIKLIIKICRIFLDWVYCITPHVSEFSIPWVLFITTCCAGQFPYILTWVNQNSSFTRIGWVLDHHENPLGLQIGHGSIVKVYFTLPVRPIQVYFSYVCIHCWVNFKRLIWFCDSQAIITKHVPVHFCQCVRVEFIKIEWRNQCWIEWIWIIVLRVQIFVDNWFTLFECKLREFVNLTHLQGGIIGNLLEIWILLVSYFKK